MSGLRPDKPEVPLLDAENYQLWKAKMQMFLTLKGLAHAITEDDATAGDSAKAKAYIGLSVSDHHVPVVVNSVSAKAAWNELQNIFEPKIAGRTIKLQRDLHNLRMQANETVEVYLGRARQLLTDLTVIGFPISEHQVVTQAIAGLPSRFDAVVVYYQQQDGQLSLSSIQARLIQHEHLLIIRAEQPSESVAFNAQHNNRKGKGQQRQANAGAGAGSGNRPKCGYCGIMGHTTEECRRRKREQGSHNEGAGQNTGNSGSTQRRQQSVAFAATNQYTGKWLLDSACERHICTEASYFVDLKPSSGETVAYGNNGVLPVEGIGTIILPCIVEDVDADVTFNHVRYVPAGAVNLLSVSRIAKKSTVSFTDKHCTVYLDPSTPVMRGVCAPGTGVYVLQTREKPHPAGTGTVLTATATAAAATVNQPTAAYSATPATADIDSATLWHRRFAHLGYDNLSLLATHQMVTDLPVTPAAFQALKTTKCDPCDAAKQTRVPHPVDSTHAAAPLDLVHMDVCGPFSTIGIGNSKYFATFLDDYSRLSMVRVLQAKSDVSHAVQEVLALLENLTGHKVKSVRTDCGTEYVNAGLRSYFESKGIIHQKSAPYTPQQNGRAERLNRVLLERVRAMLEQSQMKKSLWPEAVQTANYIRNRSPSTAIGHVTPLEKLTGQKPSVKHLRIFGCPVSVKLPLPPSKLGPTSTAGFMMGYDSTAVNYRIYIPDRNKVIVTPEVKFYAS